MRANFRLIGVLVAFLYSGIVFGQEVQFELSGNNLDSVYTIPDFKLTLELSATADNGPALDDCDIPGSPPSLFISNTDTIFFVGNETPLIKECREDDGSRIVWRLRIEFGDPDQTGASDGNVTLDWSGSGSNPFDVFTNFNVNLFDPVDNFKVVDMKTDDDSKHTFIPSQSNEVRDVFIIFAEVEQVIPIAIDDKSATVKNTAKEIDVLSNDVSVSGGSLSITPGSVTQSTMGFTPTINGDKIIYQPSGDVTGTDTFTYTVSDGSSISLPATVTVDVDDIVFTRSIEELEAFSDEGALVTVTVEYTGSIGDNLILTENFDRHDDALGFYSIPSGSGLHDLEIIGTNPPNLAMDADGGTLTNDPPSPIVKFQWNSGSIPASGFSFQYRIVGNKADRTEKCIVGQLSVGSTTVGGEVESCFTPVSDLIHSADYQGGTPDGPDSKIDATELFDVIVLFNAGEYHINPTENSGYGPDTGNQTGRPHSADYQGGSPSGADFKIDATELFDVIVLFNAGCYEKSETENSGFGPGTSCE